MLPLIRFAILTLVSILNIKHPVHYLLKSIFHEVKPVPLSLPSALRGTYNLVAPKSLSDSLFETWSVAVSTKIPMDGVPAFRSAPFLPPSSLVIPTSGSVSDISMYMPITLDPNANQWLMFLFVDSVVAVVSSILCCVLWSIYSRLPQTARQNPKECPTVVPAPKVSCGTPFQSDIHKDYATDVPSNSGSDTFVSFENHTSSEGSFDRNSLIRKRSASLAPISPPLNKDLCIVFPSELPPSLGFYFTLVDPLSEQEIGHAPSRDVYLLHPINEEALGHWKIVKLHLPPFVHDPPLAQFTSNGNINSSNGIQSNTPLQMKGSPDTSYEPSKSDIGILKMAEPYEELLDEDFLLALATPLPGDGFKEISGVSEEDPDILSEYKISEEYLSSPPLLTPLPSCYSLPFMDPRNCCVIPSSTPNDTIRGSGSEGSHIYKEDDHFNIAGNTTLVSSDLDVLFEKVTKASPSDCLNCVGLIGSPSSLLRLTQLHNSLPLSEDDYLVPVNTPNEQDAEDTLAVDRGDLSGRPLCQDDSLHMNIKNTVEVCEGVLDRIISDTISRSLSSSIHALPSPSVLPSPLELSPMSVNGDLISTSIHSHPILPHLGDESLGSSLIPDTRKVDREIANFLTQAHSTRRSVSESSRSQTLDILSRSREHQTFEKQWSEPFILYSTKRHEFTRADGNAKKPGRPGRTQSEHGSVCSVSVKDQLHPSRVVQIPRLQSKQQQECRSPCESDKLYVPLSLPSGFAGQPRVSRQFGLETARVNQHNRVFDADTPDSKMRLLQSHGTSPAAKYNVEKQMNPSAANTNFENRVSYRGTGLLEPFNAQQQVSQNVVLERNSQTRTHTTIIPPPSPKLVDIEGSDYKTSAQMQVQDVHVADFDARFTDCFQSGRQAGARAKQDDTRVEKLPKVRNKIYSGNFGVRQIWPCAASSFVRPVKETEGIGQRHVKLKPMFNAGVHANEPKR